MIIEQKVMGIFTFIGIALIIFVVLALRSCEMERAKFSSRCGVVRACYLKLGRLENVGECQKLKDELCPGEVK